MYTGQIPKQVKEQGQTFAKAVKVLGQKVDSKTIQRSRKEVKLLLKAWQKDPALKKKTALREALRVYISYDKLGKFLASEMTKTKASKAKKDAKAIIAIDETTIRNGLAAIGLVGLVGTLAVGFKRYGLLDSLKNLRAKFWQATKDAFSKSLEEATQEVKKQDAQTYELISQWELQNQTLIKDGLLGFLKALVSLPLRIVKKIVSYTLIKVSLFLLKLGSWASKVLKPIAKAAEKVLQFATDKVLDIFIVKPLSYFVPNPLILTPIKLASSFLWNAFGMQFALRLVLGPQAATAFAFLYIANKIIAAYNQAELIASINDTISFFTSLKDLEFEDDDALEKELESL